MVKTSKFDAADYLKTPAAIAAYLTEAFETDDAAYICVALDTVARAKGMANVAKATGLGRESLYKAFSGSSTSRSWSARRSSRCARAARTAAGTSSWSLAISPKRSWLTMPGHSTGLTGRRITSPSIPLVA